MAAGFGQGFASTFAPMMKLGREQNERELTLEIARRRLDAETLNKLRDQGFKTYQELDKALGLFSTPGNEEGLEKLLSGAFGQIIRDNKAAQDLANTGLDPTLLPDKHRLLAKQNTAAAKGKTAGDETVAKTAAILGKSPTDLTEADRSRLAFGQPLARDQKITELSTRLAKMGNVPVSQDIINRATDIVDRNIEIRDDPLGRGAVAVDLVNRKVDLLTIGPTGNTTTGDDRTSGQPSQPADTGQSQNTGQAGSTGQRPAAGQKPQPAKQAPSPEPTSVFEAVEALGLVPAAKELGAKVLGQVPGMEQQARQTSIIRARTALRSLRESIIGAYNEGGDRTPVVQQVRILEMLPSMGILESPGSGMDQLLEVKANLEFQRNQDKKDADDQTLPADSRKKAFARAKALSGVIARMGEPKQKQPTEGGQGTGGWSIKRIQ